MRTSGALVAALLMTAGGTHAADSQTTRPDSVPRLLRTIEFGDYGGAVVRFGDLNGDGQIEALVVQELGTERGNCSNVTCLTAIDLEGRVLWQVGKPDPHNVFDGSDTPVQIHDIDGDGQVEVVYQDAKNLLNILDGRTGRMKRQVQLEGGHDCILFADLTGSGRAQQMVLKDRYSRFWVYDPTQDFKLLWSKEKAVTGHYGINYDFNGDGKDELFIGYTLYAPDGKVIWSHPEFPSGRSHDDAVDVKRVDGKPVMALATSSDAIAVDAAGNVLFRKPYSHTQHAMLGRFRTDLPGMQAFYISRNEREATPGTRPGQAGVTETLYTLSGALLWDNTKQKEADKDGFVTQAVVIGNWTGNPDENFVCLNRRGNRPPALLDGWGREITVFPIPARPSRRGAEGPARKAGPPDTHERYTNDYIKHMDLYGDSREEILIFNEYALYIFTNDAPVAAKAASGPGSEGWHRASGPLPEQVEWYNDTIYNGRR